MKILHINAADRGGGAAIAARRHHEAMRRAGIDSHMHVLMKSGDDPFVSQHRVNRLQDFVKRAFNKAFINFMSYYATWSWARFGFDFSGDPEVKDADVIILHWVNGYTLSLKSIERILKTGKPVYWFMHDMWPVTGGCHHSLDCDRYQTHCQACPMANKGKGTFKTKDLSWHQFERKLKHLAPYPNLSFLTPSKWLADIVRQSALFSDHEVAVVRNVLDTDVFKPCDKEEARRRLGLPTDRKLILFGADSIKSLYKGWPLLRDALSEPIGNADAVIYGSAPDGLQDEIGIPLHAMGYISDTGRMIDLYSACDVFVTPSLADNYPNVLIEAMACGLPCVGTNIGGIPEIVRPPLGRLAVSRTPQALRDGITDILYSDVEGLKSLSYRMRRQIIMENSYARLPEIWEPSGIFPDSKYRK